MFKLKSVIFLIKKNILAISFSLFLIFLVLFSKTNLFAAQAGLTLWAKNVVPSLFPFFIATELLNYTNVPYFLGKMTNRFMRPLFNVPGEGSYAFIMGIISGYPVGAKIVNNFIENGTCTKSEAERLLAFTNNSGPLFIIGTVGISLFGDITVGIILFITHILSCLTVGLIFGLISKYSCVKRKRSYRNNSIANNCNLSDLGTILSNSISNAISTILLIGGFIVLFSIIISILNNLNLINLVANILTYLHIPNIYVNSVLTGLLELTNGVNSLSLLHTKNMSTQIILTAFLLGFAGISIFLQIFSIASKNNLSMKPYFIGKTLQGFLAAFYTFCILYYFDFLYFNL